MTYHVRRAGPVGVGGWVGGWAVCIVVGVPQVPLAPAPFPLVDHQVDRHLTLQAGDVAVTEVVAKLVNLKKDKLVLFCGFSQKYLADFLSWTISLAIFKTKFPLFISQ